VSRITSTPVIPLVIALIVSAAAPIRPAAAESQLQPGAFVTFILPEVGNHPEPRDLEVKLGVGGSANEQPTDVLIYLEGTTSTFSGPENNPALCAGGTVQSAELLDPESKRPKRTINVITQHPNAAIPPRTRLEEIQVLSKCLDAVGKVYIIYMGTIRVTPEPQPSTTR
jgi:hypothetical protein